ncbi:MAG: RNA-guided pseudouridylation complex pseudouridine synthase subunit Cbf5 [Candidatus Aenigmarchaeota archaeon]|nr:RNA-guided pseudouridylation complex pseudouridine synthase subunit Cbf5 [Candidatus Aenigmarchaeota archaeon]
MANLQKSVVLIDKPAGPTSFDVVESVTRILGIEKAGHAGTLDPNVTGLLLIALGEARKCMPLLNGMDKEYEGEMLFHEDISEDSVKELAKQFTGKIKQIPPVKSAVARKERERIVRSFEILETNGRLVSFRILCEAGTYIRKICHDMGEKAGSGAQMSWLRRTGVGPFSVDEAVTLERLEKEPEAHLLEIEDVLLKVGVKRISIKKENGQDVRNGKPIIGDYVSDFDSGIKKGDNVFFAIEGSIVGIGSSSVKFSGLGKTKSQVAKIDRVILE